MPADRLLTAALLVAGNAAFWALVLARVWASRREAGAAAGAVAGRSRRADRVLTLATAAYVAYYVAGLAWLVHPPLLGPELWRPTAATAAVGVALMVAGLALMGWSLLVFRSWRVRAEVDDRHELMTAGPFALVRHPIYAGIVTFYAASLLLVPRPATLAVVAAVAWSHDLRARAEEEALLQAFGARYRTYMGRTRRLVPGVY